MIEIKIWDNKLPKKEGFYWFYGKRWGIDDIELRTIKVIKISNGYYYSDNLINEEAIGYWQEITKPDVSNLYFPKV